MTPHDPTHFFVAQRVRLIDQEGCWAKVEFEDWSIGWSSDELMPIVLPGRIPRTLERELNPTREVGGCRVCTL